MSKYQVKVGNVIIGGGMPVVVQSMTNTDTADIEATYKQIIELYEAGSEIVRITVNNEDSARAVPIIHERLIASGYNIPLVGCFHYNGHKLLSEISGCAEALSKYRINPGNVGFGEKRDKQFEIIINQAIKYNKPIRIGVNWGSLDESISKRLMDENLANGSPKSVEEVTYDAMIESALNSAKMAEDIGLGPDKIIISCKVSKVEGLIKVYRELARKCNYALHLGLTEAGMGTKGIVATTSALSTLLMDGIGDTIRASITPMPGDSRTQEVHLCREILQSIGLRQFKPEVTACPGCGRTTSTFFQELAQKVNMYLEARMKEWKDQYIGVENINIAVMGCIVNGPGESKMANIGISLPGNGENPSAPVFIDGKKSYTLKGIDIDRQFIEIVESYIEKLPKIQKIDF